MGELNKNVRTELERLIAQAEQQVLTGRAADANPPRGARAKFDARQEATARMVVYDAARQGLIRAWELATGQTWSGERVMYGEVPFS